MLTDDIQTGRSQEKKFLIEEIYMETWTILAQEWPISAPHDSFLSAQRCHKHCFCTISFNPHNHLEKWRLLLFPFYKRGNLGKEQLMN